MIFNMNTELSFNTVDNLRIDKHIDIDNYNYTVGLYSDPHLISTEDVNITKGNSIFPSKFNVSDVSRMLDKKSSVPGGEPDKNLKLNKLEQLFARFTVNVSYNKKSSMIHIKMEPRYLKKALNSLYDEKSLFRLFQVKYPKMTLFKYNMKLIKKLVIDDGKSVFVHEFFALELYKIFEELYVLYGYKFYLNIAEKIRKKTWIKDLTKGALVTHPISPKVKSLFSPEFVLFEYQQEFVELYESLKQRLNLNGYILSFDQGLGKSLTTTYLYEHINCDRMIIVCPKTVTENWANELRKYYVKFNEDESLFTNEVYAYGINGYKITKDTKYIIVNNEALGKILNDFKYTSNTMLVVDESQNFRNMNGKRVQQLLDVSNKFKPTDTIVLSGTPIKAQPNEIVPTLLLLDPKFTIEDAKIYNYCFALSNPLSVSIVQERFGLVMYRKSKADVNADIPPKIENKLYLSIKDTSPYILSTVKKEITERFSEIYTEEFKNRKDIFSLFKQYVNKYSTASRLKTMEYLAFVSQQTNNDGKSNAHELTQVEFHDFANQFIIPNISHVKTRQEFVKLQKSYVTMKQSCMGRAVGEILPPRRRDMFIDMYDENFDEIMKIVQDAHKKTIIFSMSLDTIKHIEADLKSKGIKYVKIVGGTKNRVGIIEDFANDPDCDILLAVSQALREGVNITCANNVIHIGEPWRRTDTEQCNDRTHRHGQTHPVTIWYTRLRSDKKNLSDRMSEISDWSGNMFDSLITETIVDNN